MRIANIIGLKWVAETHSHILILLYRDSASPTMKQVIFVPMKRYYDIVASC
jgi:hypothetical protein